MPTTFVRPTFVRPRRRRPFVRSVAAADVTPPTVGTWVAPAAGTTITGVLSESGCVAAGGGSSGSGGFTLTGTPATVSGWSISGTTLTLSLTNLVYQGEVVTVAYDRANTTDDIRDAASNFLATFTAVSVTNNSTQTGGSGGGGSVFSSPVVR